MIASLMSDRESKMSAALDNRPVVFVVDDDISVRESLELLIRYAGWRCETYASATEFLARPRNAVPSCLVLDVHLPDLSGLDLQQRLAPGRLDMPIIFITGYGDVPMTVKAMKAGAVEFLTKPFRDQELLDAVRVALENNRDQREKDKWLANIKASFDKLTPREIEVITLVSTGLMK